tara:strand:- start:371 stop:556 length:186 start_codon:yes stop_codon:yes gene_type:complete
MKMTNDPNINHLITLFKDAHSRSLDNICTHPLEAEDIENLAEDLGYGILAEILKENRLNDS